MSGNTGNDAAEGGWSLSCSLLLLIESLSR